MTLEALHAGYRQIDSASFYNNESGCGAAIKASGIPRSEIFFTTKLSPVKMGYENTVAAIDQSLHDSGLEYIDLYLIHAPFGTPTTRNGSWKALCEAVLAGKIRSLGVSNYGLHHLDELDAYRRSLAGSDLATVPLSAMQYELHPWMPRREIVAYARAHHVVLQAFGPLCLGKQAQNPEVACIADRHGRKWSQVLLRWSLQKGFVPLPKSATSERIVENFDVWGFELGDEEMAVLETDAYELNRDRWDPVAWGFEGSTSAESDKLLQKRYGTAK